MGGNPSDSTSVASTMAETYKDWIFWSLNAAQAQLNVSSFEDGETLSGCISEKSKRIREEVDKYTKALANNVETKEAVTPEMALKLKNDIGIAKVNQISAMNEYRRLMGLAPLQN
jgi:hypothetical protein